MPDRQSPMTAQERRRRLAAAYRLILSWPSANETAEQGKVEGQTHSAAGDRSETGGRGHCTVNRPAAQVGGGAG